MRQHGLLSFYMLGLCQTGVGLICIPTCWRYQTRRLEHLIVSLGHSLGTYSVAMLIGVRWKSVTYNLCISWTTSCALAWVVVFLYARVVSHLHSIMSWPMPSRQLTRRLEHLIASFRHCLGMLFVSLRACQVLVGHKSARVLSECSTGTAKTQLRHSVDNFLCISTICCLFICTSCVSLALYHVLTYAVALTNPPAGTSDLHDLHIVWTHFCLVMHMLDTGSVSVGHSLCMHSDWRPMKISKTQLRHSVDNVLCVSTIYCLFICLGCVSLVSVCFASPCRCIN